MYKKIILFFFSLIFGIPASYSQINTEQVMIIGRNALYFEDYVLAIQYFNQVIRIKPYLAEPYFYRGVAKFYLEDYKGAEEDCTESIEKNPFITNAYEVRGIARQNLGNYEGAITDYKKGLEFVPENKTFLMNKAIAETQLKLYDDASKSFETLIAKYPNMYQAYLSRAQMLLEKKDTIAGLADIDKAVQLDKYVSYAYAQRAIIRFQHAKDYNGALADMDEAIRLDPNYTSYYINRGMLRYYNEDLRGAMADYDRVINMEQNNTMARYNRGLLRAQVGDNNKAIEDFTVVIKSEPENYFAYYNRALLKFATGDNKGAVKDFTVVLHEYPNFIPGYYARSEAKRKMNDIKGGEADFMYAMKLEQNHKNGAAPAKKKQQGNVVEEAVAEKTDNTSEDDGNSKTRKESDKNIRKFSSLMVSDKNDIKSKYDSEIRGRIQDKNVNVNILPPYVLTFYEKGEQVNKHVYFLKSLEDLNQASVLKKKLYLVSDEVSLSSNQINSHFNSINAYSQEIGQNPQNMMAYFGRSLDFMLVQDLSSALNDLDKTIELNNNFIFGYFNRAAVRFKQIEYQLAEEAADGTDSGNLSAVDLSRGLNKKKSVIGTEDRDFTNNMRKKRESRNIQYDMVLRDYSRVLELNPKFIYAYFNRGNLYCAQKNYRAALADYNEAVKLHPEFAEAYYNRALVYIYLGETEKGIADLSKAGELGIYTAYNLIKRLRD